MEKLEQLIASLMNISRLETAMISLTKEPILLSDLLVDAVNGVYEKARRKNIEITHNEDIAQMGNRKLVIADGKVVEQ